jgi:hypothetical protein
MSLLAITNNGVLYKDEVFAGQQVQNITRVIFRNVAGLNPDTAIDLTQNMPSADIVHSELISRVSALDNNSVVISTVLGYDVGNFEYNWYGVVAKKTDNSEVLIAVVQTPVQTKTKNASGTEGNYSVKSIVWKTANIAQDLNVSLSTLPWQVQTGTFVTKADYDIDMPNKLDANAKAVNSDKLDNKTRAEIITEARSGLSPNTDTHRAISNSVTSTSGTVSASSSAVKMAYDKAVTAQTKSNDSFKLEGKTKAQVIAEARSGLSPNTDTWRGISTSVASTSANVSASSSAVKMAYDKAVTAQTKSSDSFKLEGKTKAQVVDEAKAAFSSASKATNGYWRCLNTGVIIQWGRILIPFNVKTDVNLPLAFPAVCCSVTTGDQSGGNANTRVYLTSKSKFSLTCSGVDSTGTGVKWMAIGY